MSKYNLKSMTDEEFERQYIESAKRGEEHLKKLPKAVEAHYDAVSKRLVLELESRITLLVPVEMVQGLQTDNDEALSDFSLMAKGSQIHWNELDVQFYIEDFLKGNFGNKKWMSDLSEHLSAIGKKGGSSRSPAKRAASAANGKKGGRPRTKIAV